MSLFSRLFLAADLANILKITLLTLIMLGHTNLIICQEEEDISKLNFVEFNGRATFPQGRFKKNLGKEYFGGEVKLLRQLKAEQPFFVGLSVGINQLASFGADVERATPGQSTEIWSSTTTSGLVDLSGCARYFLGSGIKDKYFPYLEASVGFDWFYTLTTLRFEGSDESTTNYDRNDLALNYVAGAGVNVKVYENWFINLTARYISGLASTYSIKRIKIDQPVLQTIDGMEFKTSVTNRILANFGINYRF
jgi:opacity protein-like surface antigen